jgi:hypothetical protein
MTKSSKYLLFGLGAALVYIYFATQKKNSLSINGQQLFGASYNGITGATNINTSGITDLFNSIFKPSVKTGIEFSKPIVTSSDALGYDTAVAKSTLVNLKGQGISSKLLSPAEKILAAMGKVNNVLAK